MFRKLVDLLKPAGLIVLSLRHGPVEASRTMHPVSADQIGRLARDHGAFAEPCIADEDHLGRPDVCGGPGWRCGCRRVARDSAPDGGSSREAAVRLV